MLSSFCALVTHTHTPASVRWHKVSTWWQLQSLPATLDHQNATLTPGGSNNTRRSGNIVQLEKCLFATTISSTCVCCWLSNETVCIVINFGPLLCSQRKRRIRQQPAASSQQPAISNGWTGKWYCCVLGLFVCLFRFVLTLCSLHISSNVRVRWGDIERFVNFLAIDFSTQANFTGQLCADNGLSAVHSIECVFMSATWPSQQCIGSRQWRTISVVIWPKITAFNKLFEHHSRNIFIFVARRH